MRDRSAGKRLLFWDEQANGLFQPLLDLLGHGFVWPEGADHYVINHKVWTPECDEMLAAVRQVQRKAS